MLSGESMGVSHIGGGMSIEREDGVPWRTALGIVEDAQQPGRMLRAARIREGWTQREVARPGKISPRHLAALEQGKRDIPQAQARLLAQVLGIGLRVLGE